MGSEKKIEWDDQLKNLKDYIKKNPLKRVKKKVKQRTKKDPITVEGPIDAPLSKKQGSYYLHHELKDVNLKVTATPEAWRKLELFVRKHPNWFGLCFHSHFANPAVITINEKNKPRGKQKEIFHFANDIKKYAGTLYPFLKYWCNQPLKAWPDYLRRVLESVKKGGNLDNLYVVDLKSQRKLDPKGLTAYLIDQVFRNGGQSIGLKSFFEFGDRESIENFYITYIQSDKRPSKIHTQFIKDKTPQEIADLAYSHHRLNFIFQSLGVFKP